MQIQSFDEVFFDGLTQQAKASERRRAHHNIHQSLDEPCQRLFIAMETDSFVVPHRHSNPSKPECFIGVRGHIALFIFDDNGTIQETLHIGPDQPILICDIPPNTWHAVVSMKSGTVFCEVKPGPYQPIDPTDIAPWSPPKDGQQEYIAKLKSTLT